MPMNWKKIQEAWEAGDKQIAVRLLEQMIWEFGLRQAVLSEFLKEVKG
jgi:hypothetical protein